MARLFALILVGLLIVDSATIIYSLIEGSFPSMVEKGAPTAYRSLYVHVPVSIASYIVLTAAALAALAYLASRKKPFYSLADSTIKAGVPLALAAFLTGSVWASESWGSFWTWDPRQVSVFFLVLAYALYFAVKNSVRDPDRGPVISMAYAFAAYATVPLSFILPRIAESLHPTPAETREFAAGGPWLFLSRLAIVSLIALTLIVAAYMYSKAPGASRALKFAPLIIVLAPLTLFSFYGLSESLGLTGYTGKVVGSKVENGALLVRVETGGQILEGYYRGAPPIEPLIVEFRGSTRVTLEDNIVAFKYNTLTGEFTTIKVVNHPVVYINTIIYAALLTLSIAAITMGGKIET